jgi:hypothetical protein
MNPPIIAVAADSRFLERRLLHLLNVFISCLIYFSWEMFFLLIQTFGKIFLKHFDAVNIFYLYLCHIEQKKTDSAAGLSSRNHPVLPASRTRLIPINVNLLWAMLQVGNVEMCSSG